jgi:hypothetical protein
LFFDFLQNGGDIQYGVWCKIFDFLVFFEFTFFYGADFQFDWLIFVAKHLKNNFEFSGTP